MILAELIGENKEHHTKLEQDRMIRRIFTTGTHHVVFISRTSCLCLYTCKRNQHCLHKNHVTISIKSNTTDVISTTITTYSFKARVITLDL